MKTKNGQAIETGQLLEDLRTVVRDGEELLKATAGTLKERTVAGVQKTDKLVREHPYTTIGVVFGIGVLAGVLVAAYFIHEGRERQD